MFKDPIWIGSPIDVRYADAALSALDKENDVRYWDEYTGITKIDRQRWEKAQEYELTTWMTYNTNTTSDRDAEHAELFDNYNMVPADLGDVLEIGCGPFTQTRSILVGRSAASITLLDPLLDEYLKHPYCSYNQLVPTPTLICSPAEEFDLATQFDTIICINVLEHVCNVGVIFNNIYRALRPGGIIIMGERVYDDLDITKLYDVGHPIRIKSMVLDRFRQQFTTLYSNGSYFIARK